MPACRVGVTAGPPERLPCRKKECPGCGRCATDPSKSCGPKKGPALGGCSAPGFWYCCSAASDCCFALLGRFLPKLKAAVSSGLFLARKPPGKATPDKSHSAAIFLSGTARLGQEQGGTVAAAHMREIRNFLFLQMDRVQFAGHAVRTVGRRALMGWPCLRVCRHHWPACARRFFSCGAGGGAKNRRRGAEALPPTVELSYRSKRNAYPPSSTGAVPMDIAIMVLAVAFFFWQTITD